MEDLVAVFEAFDERDVDYCVLRNYDGLPEGHVKGDVDVLVPSEARREINATFERRHWRKRSGDTTRQTEYEKYLVDLEQFVTVDVYWDAPTYNGLPFLDGSKVLERRRRHEWFWIPKPEDYFVGLLFHAILNKNRIRDAYRSELDRYRNRVDSADVRHHAASRFGELGVSTVDLALDGAYDEAERNKWKLVRQGLVHSPTRTLALSWNLIVLREVLRPVQGVLSRLSPFDRTPVVAVLGPDGVGKSTTVDGVAEELQQNGIRAKTAKLGVHSGVSSGLSVIRSVHNAVTNWESQKEAKAAGQSTISPRSSSLKGTVLVVDFAYRLLRAQLSDADVIVADRYVHELPVYANPGPLMYLFSVFETSPFYGVVLTDDVEEISKRSEFETESVRTFYDRLDSIQFDRFDVSNGPEETIGTLATMVRQLLS